MNAIMYAATVAVCIFGTAPQSLWLSSTSEQAPTEPDDQEVTLPPAAEQDFCCAATWKDEDGHHGSGCETIGADLVRVCINGGGEVLHCSGDWSGGKEVDC